MMRYDFGQAFDRSRDIGGLCGGGFHPGGIGMLVGGLLFLIFLIAVISVVVYIIRSGRRHQIPGPHGPMHGTLHGRYHMSDEQVEQKTNGVNSSAGNALAILNERYAKGEISKEEYLGMKDDILK